MNRSEIEFRRLQVLQAAADRWDYLAPEVARAKTELARRGPAGASTPGRTDAFRAREAIKRSRRMDVGPERIIGSDDLEEWPPTDRAWQAGRPVARIVELRDGRKVVDGFATGFVVAGDLLVTNWHVFADKADAVGTGAEFGFERDASGRIGSEAVFALNPDRFFLSNKILDVAIVAIDSAPAVGSRSLAEFGRVTLIPAQGKILLGHPISIIQHPDGRHKHWAVRQNKLLVEPRDDDLFLTYTTDTMPGSSGSPAFNYDWELVAVHHSGVPRRVNGKIMTRTDTVWHPGMPDSDIDWVANEGARVSKLVDSLTHTTIADAGQAAILRALITNSVDPLEEASAAAPIAPLPPPRADHLTVQPSRPHEVATMNITVNGTANFFLGAGATPADGGAKLIAQPPVGPLVTEKKLRFDSNYAARPGYDPRFLDGFTVPLPDAPDAELLKDGGDPLVLKYHHYSLVMHKKRRLAMWTAANADYDESKRRKGRKEFGTDTWKPDPRIPIEAQIEDLEFYQPAALFDRGHLVRREDVAWGETAKDEEFGNSDSFHWTNCTPQHEGFNRDVFGYQGLWGGLENHITSQAGFVNNRLTIFAGPVLSPNDPERDFGSGVAVKVPIKFWKVLLVVEDADQGERLRAYGFLLDQSEAIEEFGWEGRFKAGKFAEYQVRLQEITDLTRVRFPAAVTAAEAGLNVNESRPRPLRSLGDVRIR